MKKDTMCHTVFLALAYLLSMVTATSSRLLTKSDNTTCPVSPSYDGSCMVTSFHDTGDVILGMVSHLHHPSSAAWCGELRSMKVELNALVRWLLLTKLNNEVPGVTLGLSIYDNCRQMALLSRGFTSMVPTLETPGCQKSDVAAILTINTSGETAELAALATDTEIPIISPFAVAVSLDDRELYSTFLRTTPSDAVASKVIYDIVVQLGMRFVAIIYTDDLYGRESFSAMKNLFKNGSPAVCLAGSASIHLDDVDSFDKAVNTLRVSKAKVGSQGILGVLYLGQYPEAKLLFPRVHGNLGSEESKQFIWIMFEGLETEIFAGYEIIGRNTIAISPVIYLDNTDFETYWLDFLLTFLEDDGLQIADDFYYREYIENLLGCSFVTSSSDSCLSRGRTDLKDAYQAPYYDATTMDAVFVYVQALKNVHEDYCDGEPGLCLEMQQEIQKNFHYHVKQVRVSYEAGAFSYVPEAFLRRLRKFEFDDIGNPNPSSSATSFNIQQITCSAGSCNFADIGSHSNNVTTLRRNLINFYPYPGSDDPLSANDLEPIICESDCSECVKEVEFPIAYIPGDFLIAAILDFHDPYPDEFLVCNKSSIKTRMVQTSEAILYAVDRFNDPQGTHKDEPLSGRLGVVIYDSCRDGVIAVHTITDTNNIYTNKPISDVFLDVLATYR